MAFRAVAVVLLAAGCASGGPAPSMGAAGGTGSNATPPTDPCPGINPDGNVCTNKTDFGFIKCSNALYPCTEDLYGCRWTDSGGNMRPLSNCTFRGKNAFPGTAVPLGANVVFLCYGAGYINAPETDCPPED